MSILNCIVCGDPLFGRKKKYCGSACSKLEGRRQHIWRCFSITLEEYDAILEEQGGVCAICGKPPKPGKSLAVDHSHRTGKIRGLLCFLDNRRIIGARSDETIEKMYRYVSDPPAERALGREVIAPGRPRKKRSPRKRKR